MRTASLLELNDAIALDAVVASLASARRQWRALSRDGNAEAEVRRNLRETLIAHWQRTQTLDAVPPPDAVADDAPGARRALATLTNRQRALVVLSTYESMTSSEVTALLRCFGTDVDAETASAVAQLRNAAGVAVDTPLLPLLNSAASRDVPSDLADRALVASRAIRRRTFVVAAAATVILVAVAGGVVALFPTSVGAPKADPVTANIEQWGIPDDAPLPRGLPSLEEQPIDAASMAYIVGGVPVVTDGATGDAHTVLAGRPSPAWYDGNIDGVVTGLLRRGLPWTQAVLSPDGEWLLLVQATGNIDKLADTGHMYLVRVDTAVVTPVPDAKPIALAQGEASIADTVLAWAPGGGAFACVCSGKLSVFDVEPTAPRVVLTDASPNKVTDVAWGADGLVVRKLNGQWLAVSAPSTSVQRMGSPDALAISLTTPTVYLSVGITSIYALGADTSPDGGRCIWWNEDFSVPVQVTPVPDRDGRLCTPVALQPGRSGVLLVVRPDRPRPQPLPLDVVTVDTFGASTVIGALPPGTTYASFAARTVG
ncbi:MAG: hypothetical protein LH645_10550 [Actinomycetia bacterium]|nr:hypothetical protein [Actinomycetes bacterium]